MLSSIAPGSGVAVVAPAGPVPEERYREGLQILASRYRLVHAFDPARARSSIPFLAESDAARAEAFNLALRDPQVEAIFCARGGHGCLRILPLLDGRALVRRRPLLIGFSDITAIHAWAARFDVATVHGPVVTQLPELPAAEVHLAYEFHGDVIHVLAGVEIEIIRVDKDIVDIEQYPAPAYSRNAGDKLGLAHFRLFELGISRNVLD
jgi:muramoyltetrapeptide carboxypeptidase